MNTPSEIMAALQIILAGVDNLSEDTVSIGDWCVQVQPYSVIVLPPVSGQQSLLHVDGWEQVHRLRCKLTIKHQDAQTLGERVADMVPLILAALRDNDTLGLAGVVTCHPETAPVQYELVTGEQPVDEYGVLRQEVDFLISVVTCT